MPEPDTYRWTLNYEDELPAAPSARRQTASPVVAHKRRRRAQKTRVQRAAQLHERRRVERYGAL